MNPNIAKHPARTVYHTAKFTHGLITDLQEEAERQNKPPLNLLQLTAAAWGILTKGEWKINEYGRVEYRRFKYYWIDLTEAVNNATKEQQ